MDNWGYANIRGLVSQAVADHMQSLITRDVARIPTQYIGYNILKEIREAIFCE